MNCKMRLALAGWLLACGLLQLAAADDPMQITKELKKQTPEQIKAKYGEPDGKYTDYTGEHWFWAKATLEFEKGGKKCLGVTFQNGAVEFVNYYSEATMQVMIPIAKLIAGYLPVANPVTKTFDVSAANLKDKTREEIEAALGKPDCKKIDSKMEAWVYKLVPAKGKDGPTMTVTLLFRDGKSVLLKAE